jgi:hypothetical protein
VQERIDAQLQSIPGGTQISQNEIASHDGKVILTLPMLGEGVARSSTEAVVPLGTANCPAQSTCLYADQNYNGRRLRFSDCVFEDLRNWGFQDKASSWHNNQTRGTKTQVYNLRAGIFWPLWTEGGAPSNSTYVGDANNDKADGIRAC